MQQLITSDKSYLYKYRKKPTVDESVPNDLYCRNHWPNIKKIQVGRFWKCPECSGAQIRLPSGKGIKKFYKY